MVCDSSNSSTRCSTWTCSRCEPTKHGEWWQPHLPNVLVLHYLDWESAATTRQETVRWYNGWVRRLKKKAKEISPTPLFSSGGWTAAEANYLSFFALLLRLYSGEEDDFLLPTSTTFFLPPLPIYAKNCVRVFLWDFIHVFAFSVETLTRFFVMFLRSGNFNIHSFAPPADDNDAQTNKMYWQWGWWLSHIHTHKEWINIHLVMTATSPTPWLTK